MRLDDPPSSGADDSCDGNQYCHMTAAPDPRADIVNATAVLNLKSVRDTECIYLAPWQVSGCSVVVVDSQIFDQCPIAKQHRTQLTWEEQCSLYLMGVLASIRPVNGVIRYHIVYIHSAKSFRTHISILADTLGRLPVSVQSGLQSVTLACTSSFSSLFSYLRVYFLPGYLTQKTRVIVLHSTSHLHRSDIRERALQATRL